MTIVKPLKGNRKKDKIYFSFHPKYIDIEIGRKNLNYNDENFKYHKKLLYQKLRMYYEVTKNKINE